ncbi:MAG: hypothetical protein ACJATT_005444 [Myxococcota bacterium]|jgi:uncharacterized protein YbjT (DUF2867 family)
MNGKTVVVAGASGFVGRHLVDRLQTEGFRVRCGTRDTLRASSVRPGFNWVELDVDLVETLDAAFEGADALVFLVHRMRDAGADLEDSEESAAKRVLECAERAGIRRIVYLGGPAPKNTEEGEAISEHLRARLKTGVVLRSSPNISTIELRAGMVIGAGSESWLIVRDLALRLPVMILPKWMMNRSQPIWIGDVVDALNHALANPMTASHAFDLPGPETLTAQNILIRVGARRGIRPLMIPVPVLTPSLSSHWIRLVSRADFDIAKRLVHGLTHDLVAEDAGYWNEMPERIAVPLDDAIDRALAAEKKLGGAAAFWENLAHRVARKAR